MRLGDIDPTERELQKMMLRAGFDEDRLEEQVFPGGQPDVEVSDEETQAMWNRIVMRLRASGDWEE